MSLIIDHSAERDVHWPEMLSILIQSGVTAHLRRVATLPMPEDERHSEYRDISRAKTDALVGLTRCFEQMLARDTVYVERMLRPVLRSLADDRNLPMTVQWQAARALEGWNK